MKAFISIKKRKREGNDGRAHGVFLRTRVKEGTSHVNSLSTRKQAWYLERTRALEPNRLRGAWNSDCVLPAPGSLFFSSSEEWRVSWFTELWGARAKLCVESSMIEKFNNILFPGSH